MSKTHTEATLRRDRLVRLVARLSWIFLKGWLQGTAFLAIVGWVVFALIAVLAGSSWRPDVVVTLYIAAAMSAAIMGFTMYTLVVEGWDKATARKRDNHDAVRREWEATMRDGGGA